MTENAQRISVRVYYEDTDFSGRVYHASYLRFLERGRTEWLRAYGFQHDTLGLSLKIAFAVTSIRADFKAAASIDDLLEIVTEFSQLRGPVVLFEQRVLREGSLLLNAAVEIVAIKGDRAVRPPAELRQVLGPLAPSKVARRIKAPR